MRPVRRLSAEAVAVVAEAEIAAATAVDAEVTAAVVVVVAGVAAVVVAAEAVETAGNFFSQIGPARIAGPSCAM
jgi:hypothetical protein